jgi:hypothetical protein
MGMTDARVLYSLKLAEQKADKGSIQRSATEEYLLLFDQKNPSFQEALDDETTWPNLGNQKLPQIDDEITISGTKLYCTSRDLSYYQDNERALVMSVRYDAKDDEAGSEGNPGNDPEAWKRVQVQSVDMQQPARGWRSLINARDAQIATEKPAINSAGDPVDGLEEQSSMLRFTYTNTIASNPNFTALKEAVNKCNFGFMQILGMGLSFYTVRCTGFNASYDQKNNTWSVTVEFLYNPNGWEIRFYDVGFNEIDANGDRVAILDKRGNPVSSPVALDGQGKASQPQMVLENENLGPATRVLYPYIATDLENVFADARI